MEESDRSLVLVSNRLPFQLQEEGNEVLLKQSDGGLVTALKSYFDTASNRSAFQQIKWFGAADFPEKRWKKFKRQASPTGEFTVEPVFIEPKTYSKYYNGFCNATLWPLFHYFPSYVVYEQEYFEKYEEVNEQFAEEVLKTLRPGDTLWIHDYQLFLLPQLIRDKMPDVSIGFFLHIPFPSYEVFRLMHRPWKEKIIRGLLGADLIGFHTHEYVQHFLKSVRMVLGYDHAYRTISLPDRLVKADMFPLGIDYKKFNTASQQPEVLAQMEDITKNFPDKKIIFSVDRLDYTKGVTHRLLGFEQLLKDHPEWIEKVVFIMVVVPSRQIISKYNERRILIEENVGRINGKYSTLSWQPVIYRYNQLGFEELCALYHVADVALITPLRDGMNLVAKEYVACCSEQQGVLILSELAGAANELGEALLVNPLDTVEMAQAIQQALMMPPEEQRRKMQLMQQRLTDYDVHSWVNDFIYQLSEIKQQQKQEERKFVTPSIRREIIQSFHEAHTRNLLLDYDGTLVAYARHPREAVPDKDLLKLLATLGADPKTNLTIISGRDSQVLENWFKNVPVNLVAEHGAVIKRVDHTWSQETEMDQAWKNAIRPTLEMFTKRCPGSFVEEKIHTLAWHYRNVETELGFTRSRELLDTLFHLVRNGQLQVIDGNKVIEVRLAGVDKGIAARKLVEESNPDFVLAIGDDKTDEDMFRILADRAVTIKVGPGHSVAQYSIASQRDVIRLLHELVS
ncbi:MAG TPA: bifunctional alpha,alpha-trehalose-phosphate synthase (UDP-forming)/trehalose-phosphatase [Ohtaekwangia sp.]|uniref:bifunctional alpha,alpha-trehalose-phosphate synthase (UDP-forming)/trehalose-phosphatase n=1 Tax=Ohtaekwangia sp. TaxID=2066019 RepID=UPI002F945815